MTSIDIYFDNEIADFANGFKNDINNCLSGISNIEFEVNLIDINKNIEVKNTKRHCFLVISSSIQNLPAQFSEVKPTLILTKNFDFVFNNTSFENCNYLLFYDFELNSNRIRLYNSSSNNLNYRKYWLRVLDLCQTISDNNPNNSIKTFINYCSDDITPYYDSLARRLSKHNQTVTPQNKISVNEQQLQETIINSAKEADLLIFLLGNSTNNKFNANCNSFDWWQYNTITTNLSKDELKSKQIIAWHSTGSKTTNQQQIAFIDELKKGTDLINIDFFQMPFDEFINQIFEKQLHIATRKTIDSSIEKELTYIINDKKDNDNIKNLCKTLNEKKITSTYIDFTKSETNLLELHRNNLLNAENIIIFDNNNNFNWLQSKIKDIKKAPGLGREKSIKSKIIISKDTQRIKPIIDSDIQLIEHTNEINIDQLLTNIKL